MRPRTRVAAAVAPLIAAAAATAAIACAKAYGEDATTGDLSDAAVVGEVAVDVVAPSSSFCAKSKAPICDEFATTISPAWTRRLAADSTLEIDSLDFFSGPGALRAKIVPGSDPDAAPAPVFALIEQQVALSAATRDIYVEAQVRTLQTDAIQGGVHVLRLDSRGVPAILVVEGQNAHLATESTQTLLQIGSEFAWPPMKWHAVSLHFVRVPGTGATVQISVDHALVAEGQLEVFDPPFTLQIGGYRQTSASPADVLYDDVTLHE